MTLSSVLDDYYTPTYPNKGKISTCYFQKDVDLSPIP